MRRTSTSILISAMQTLAKDIQSDDGIVNAAISEAAERLQELKKYQEFYAYISFLFVTEPIISPKCFFNEVERAWKKYQRR